MNISDIPTYIIGLNDPTEKIQYLQENGINAKWFKGIKGEKVSDKTIDRYINPYWKRFGPKSAIGCAISHMKLWELAKKNKNEYTLILEDDVILNPEFDKYIKKILNNLPDDLDLLYLGGLGACNPTFLNIIFGIFFGNITKNIKSVKEYIKKPVNLMATHAYIISSKGAHKLIELLKNNINNHIDVCIQQLYLKERINNYIVYPELIYQTSTLDINKSNNTVNFPILINKCFSKVYIDRYVTLDFGLNINFLRLGQFSVNGIVIIFFFVGFILSRFYTRDFKKLSLIFLGILIPELLLRKINKKKFNQIILCYLIFMIPSYIGKLNIKN